MFVYTHNKKMQGIWEEGVCKQTVDADYDMLNQLGIGAAEEGDVMKVVPPHRCILFSFSFLFSLFLSLLQMCRKI